MVVAFNVACVLKVERKMPSHACYNHNSDNTLSALHFKNKIKSSRICFNQQWFFPPLIWQSRSTVVSDARRQKQSCSGGCKKINVKVWIAKPMENDKCCHNWLRNVFTLTYSDINLARSPIEKMMRRTRKQECKKGSTRKSRLKLQVQNGRKRWFMKLKREYHESVVVKDTEKPYLLGEVI